MTNRHEKARGVMLMILAIVVTVVMLFPVYWMFNTSFKTQKEIFRYPPTFVPEDFTMEGYQYQLRLGSKLPLGSYFTNSMIIASLTMAISTGLSSLSAYGLARFRLKSTRYILLGFLVSQMLPVVVFLSPLFITFRLLGLLDTYFAPVTLTAIHGIPFAVLTLRPYFMSIPTELEDAAVIDGCGRWTTFLRVMAPIASPGIAVSAAVTFMFGWGNLMGPLTFLRTEAKLPLTVTMFKAIGVYGTDWNMLMAYAVVLALPVMVIFLFLQKAIVSGLTAGAIK